MKTYISIFLLFVTAHWLQANESDTTYLHFPGKPGKKHIVFLSGDEEYRSEEGLPMLAQMMNRHHGFECSVLFSLDENGFVNPDNRDSVGNPEILDNADLIVMLLRFRSWTDHAMQKFEDAYHRGVPIIALRTSTHAFKHPKGHKWHRYNSKSEVPGWEKGFGQKVLGEWWGSHHGKHKVEGGWSVVEKNNESNEILNSVEPFFCLADVYTADPPKDVTILLRGAVTKSLDRSSERVKKKNDPMQPIAWTRIVENEKGTKNRVFMCMMGAAIDLKEEGLRRLIANSIYWGLSQPVPKKANVDIPVSYKPSMYGFRTFKKNMKPKDHIPQL